jgi:hypothetical protein
MGIFPARSARWRRPCRPRPTIAGPVLSAATPNGEPQARVFPVPAWNRMTIVCCESSLRAGSQVQAGRACATPAQLRQLLICGAATHPTVRDAMMLDDRVPVLSDATATWSAEDHAAALNSFFLFFGDVMTTEGAALRLAARPCARSRNDDAFDQQPTRDRRVGLDDGWRLRAVRQSSQRDARSALHGEHRLGRTCNGTPDISLNLFRYRPRGSHGR